MTFPPEFSHPVAVDSLVPDKPRRVRIAATDAECAALARRFDLQSLSGLTADLSVTRLSESNIIKVEGEIGAEVVQTCVVSLQGVPAEIKTHLDTYFTEDGKEGFDDDLPPDAAMEEEFPDTVMQNGQLDLGELVAQYLALELDPYPRAPGVSLAAQMTGNGGDNPNRPFHILKNLKTDDDE
ncbi:MAG: DUF177 domain-containing protein [Alphaproteobacteria bacterium]|nr:DUF177 domain-containing protein [Alphaproteobacteria bacterium]MDE2336404.1 DUF177 domain-containing protein [Alphaproteobacteria bacterium]